MGRKQKPEAELKDSSLRSRDSRNNKRLAVLDQARERWRLYRQYLKDPDGVTEALGGPSREQARKARRRLLKYMEGRERALATVPAPKPTVDVKLIGDTASLMRAATRRSHQLEFAFLTGDRWPLLRKKRKE